MLAELHIENLGVIERCDLVLGAGMTAITGETGAGKTMLVDALELVVGGRADPLIVRHGCAEARVDARFVSGDRELVLSRVVPAEGRSRAYVDGRPATASALADVATDLVDLHGQHAHQRLLSTASQRAALDAYGAVDLGELRAARARLTEIDAELAALGGDERTRARELDLARYQLAELEAAAITGADEDDELHTLEDTLADAVEHRRAAAAAHDAIAGDDGARDLLAAAANRLSGRAPFRSHADRLAALLAELDDLVDELRSADDDIVEDPERLDAVRTRRQQLHDLRRKYGDELADVLAYQREVAERVEELAGRDERAAQLDNARAAAARAVGTAEATVREQRRAAAEPLGAAITERLTALAMPAATVAVHVGDDGAGDDVEFRLAANPGTPPLPFTKVASGGELARVMLAVRLVLVELRGALDTDQSSLVFDEVDAGIGGDAATAVGRALAAVADGAQVLVVTHLPQVAAAATAQIAVRKTVTAGSTEATAEAIGGERRVTEIARMLSGDLGGSAATEHARELLRSEVV